jgi:hypothetical protein
LASINLTVDDTVAARVLDAFAQVYNYNPDTDGTKAAFAKRKVIAYVLGIVQRAELESLRSGFRTDEKATLDDIEAAVKPKVT